MLSIDDWVFQPNDQILASYKNGTDNSSLIYKVVSFMENRESLGQHNWLSTIKFILHYCGMDDKWFNPHTINNGSIAPKCSVILRNKFVDYWSSLLHDQHSGAYNGKKDQKSFKTLN